MTTNEKSAKQNLLYRFDWIVDDLVVMVVLDDKAPLDRSPVISDALYHIGRNYFIGSLTVITGYVWNNNTLFGPVPVSVIVTVEKYEND
ncbi:hypothetical protein A2533_04595 [Candidatus Falkowbacteria bacterium RIFOXYD2_FULL_35_9]|uniref:Uncharacterized protein n=1 Tax=Candidatus Falkowbacteria bacterium RIFOXYC2_FULL_36_12 TaxID=1798002 RepID=A0A1F5T4I9_9BACT|nr:MAG: hypothetical protein A2300_01165 [Candidatus Falkowbacteria bacterium RIFOXYB2_FULL_35_7]OGF33371.1 MAG: hypothetical protein A2478_01570 [Candidatus Falkowbacteria bacterium RIFOXYC2_FULL_36_12]OGF46053.1 MAG: hypothetical protein A2533_04595 [Candidatus Falkowbacteria bacterium RIFOXYD2_FULL_35_9]